MWVWVGIAVIILLFIGIMGWVISGRTTPLTLTPLSNLPLKEKPLENLYFYNVKNINSLKLEVVRKIISVIEENLKDYEKIEIYNRNGNLGLREKTPYDRILISARTGEIPKDLISQLKSKGILVAPVGNSYIQAITSFRKENGKLKVNLIFDIHYLS